MEGTSTETFACIIAVGEKGTSVIIHSEPDIFINDTFDGDFLEDNVHNEMDIPKKSGLYKCTIVAEHLQYDTLEGPEYDCTITIKDIETINISESAR